MDDFNAKKSRAQKLRQDKYRDRPKKRVDSGSHGGRGDSKDFNKGKSLTAKDMPTENETQRSDAADLELKTQVFSKRKLVSNWDRYEETVVNRFEQEVNNSGALFEELLSMPISGGHLKMKHEHEWEKEKSELQLPWFQLDIQAVEKNLTTIPFHKRQDLPRCMFSENDLQRMISRAEKNAASLSDINEGILLIKSLSVSNRADKDADLQDKPMPDTDNRASGNQSRLSETKSYGTKENQGLDDLLALEQTPTKCALVKPTESIINSGTTDENLTKSKAPAHESADSPISATTSQPSVSLDDWLDSILDD